MPGAHHPKSSINCRRFAIKPWLPAIFHNSLLVASLRLSLQQRYIDWFHDLFEIRKVHREIQFVKQLTIGRH